MDTTRARRRSRRGALRARGPHDPGTVAVVHPRLGPTAAAGLRASGFALVADTGRLQVWVRYPPDPLTPTSGPLRSGTTRRQP